jgi:hypothetical protein
MFEMQLHLAVESLHTVFGCEGIEDFAYMFEKLGMSGKAEVVRDCHRAMH